MGAAEFALAIFAQLPTLMKAGKDVAGLISAGTQKLQAMVAENRGPTPEEWSALNAQIHALQTELHAP